MMPHTPHNPPERLLDKYKDKTPSPHVAKYWAMVEWFDETCGQLLDHLETEKLAENTIVVYVTDNGWIQDPDGTLSVRSKRTPYDGGLRTPIMVRWPGKVKPRTSDELASLARRRADDARRRRTPRGEGLAGAEPARRAGGEANARRSSANASPTTRWT